MCKWTLDVLAHFFCERARFLHTAFAADVAEVFEVAGEGAGGGEREGDGFVVDGSEVGGLGAFGMGIEDEEEFGAEEGTSRGETVDLEVGLWHGLGKERGGERLMMMTMVPEVENGGEVMRI
ncbi:hypothetical protein H4I95_00669 [Botrytis cinerea]